MTIEGTKIEVVEQIKITCQKKFSPRNKSWLEKLEQKYSISKTNHDYIIEGTKNLGRETNQDYMGNKTLFQETKHG
jgi:hypothetical protein